MTEEIRKETEEEQTAAGTEPETKAACEEQAEETMQQEETPEQEVQEDAAQDQPQAEQESSQEEDDVVDGEYVQADEESKKGSFFRKKKDKKDEKIAELVDRVQRQMAEFDNFRKRSEKEKGQMFDMGARSVIEKILPVIDNFERGIDALSEEEKEGAFAQGVIKIYQQLMTAMEELGVKAMDAKGKEFNPDLHNAVMHEEDPEMGENLVAEEFQKGYMYKDSVLRYSMVKVVN